MSRSEQIYKLVILGAGPAGLAAARWALELGIDGRELCLVERGEVLLSGWRSAQLPDCLPLPETTPWQRAEGPLFENAWIEALDERPLGVEPIGGPKARARGKWAQFLGRAEVNVRLGAKATEVVRDADGNFRVWLEQGPPLAGQRLMVATGGHRNHALRWAQEWGLPLQERYPAGLNLRLGLSRGRSWQTLPAVPARVGLHKVKGAEALEAAGELLSQHPWLGGSAVTRVSAVCARALAAAKYKGELRVNWLPGIDGGLSPKLVSRFQEQAGRRLLEEYPWEGIAPPLWPFVLKGVGLPGQTPWRSLSPRQGQMLMHQLTSTRLKFDGYRLDPEAGLQAGGIALEALVPGTFEVRKTPGLFWIGEGVDLHALDPVANLWLAEVSAHHAARAVVLSLT